MTISITIKNVTLSIMALDTLMLSVATLSVVMLSAFMLSVNAECHYASIMAPTYYTKGQQQTFSY
jgi:hypothetical protein